MKGSVDHVNIGVLTRCGPTAELEGQKRRFCIPVEYSQTKEIVLVGPLNFFSVRFEAKASLQVIIQVAPVFSFHLRFPAVVQANKNCKLIFNFAMTY